MINSPLRQNPAQPRRTGMATAPAAAGPAARARCAVPCFTTAADTTHTGQAVRARSLARREGPVWDSYAHCDRAPFGWEHR